MSVDRIQDYADRVRKFYYRRSFLCEQMCDEASAGCKSRISFEQKPEDLPPIDYEPLNKLYVDSHVLACTALDGLSFLWRVLEKGSIAKLRNAEGYTRFLLGLNLSREMNLVSTPFLFLSLEKQNIEQRFRELVRQRWGSSWDDHHQAHPIYNDPTIDDLALEYSKVSTGEIGNIKQTLLRFTYSGLVYTYYRCSFVHQFGGSPNTGGYSRGEEMSVCFESGLQWIEVDEMGNVTWDEEVYPESIPVFGIGLGVLTSAIRMGADFIHDLMIKKNCTEFPRSSTLIKIYLK